MSLTSLYQTASSNKPTDPKNKVLYAKSYEQFTESVANDVALIRKSVENLSSDILRIDAIVKELQGLKMAEFCDKHANMKANYNSFASSYNVFQADVNTVVLDITKRVNEMEHRLL